MHLYLSLPQERERDLFTKLKSQSFTSPVNLLVVQFFDLLKGSTPRVHKIDLSICVLLSR